MSSENEPTLSDERLAELEQWYADSVAFDEWEHVDSQLRRHAPALLAAARRERRLATAIELIRPCLYELASMAGRDLCDSWLSQQLRLGECLKILDDHTAAALRPEEKQP